MAGGGDQEVTEATLFKQELREHLETPRNGVKLLGKQVEILLKLIPTVCENMVEFKSLPHPVVRDILKSGWQVEYQVEALPVVVSRCQKWQSGVETSTQNQADHDTALRLALGDDAVADDFANACPLAGEAQGGAQGSVPTLLQAMNDPKTSGMLKGLSASQLKAVHSDCVGQGLPVDGVVALSASQEKGSIVHPHEIRENCAFEDPRGFDVVKKCCKYDEFTYSKLLQRGVKALLDILQLHHNLIRDYAHNGDVKQSVLLSQWLSEVSSGFKGDDEAMIHYLRAYRRLYAGRGLPMMWDERMAVRARNETRAAAGPSMSKADVEKMVASSLAAQASQMKSQIDQLKSQSRQQVRVPKQGDESAEAKAKRLAKMKCFKCGNKGHIAADCPEAGAGADEE